MPEINIDNFENVSTGAVQLDAGGPYKMKIKDAPQHKTSDSGKPYLEVKYIIVEGPEQENEIASTGSKNPAGAEITDRYYLSEGAAFKVKRLLVSCGLLEKDDKTSTMAQGKFDSDILAGQQFPCQVDIQMNNGQQYRNYMPIA